MKTASMICTYLYGSLSLIKGTIEGYIRLAKNILKGIDKIAAAALTTVRYTIDVSIKTIVNMVKVYEKELFDMLYESIFGTDKSFWCHRLWKCLALVNELLDPDSWLFKKLKEWWSKQCIRDTQVDNLLNSIRDIVSDFSKFQRIVCSAGFTVEFGISYIKQLLNWCRDQIEMYLEWLERKIKELRLQIERYLNQLIDWGLLDWLEKLLSFFTCVFDGQDSCAEIATASNFYQDAMSKLKLEKDGDGYNISVEYRNSIYGGLEGAANRLTNLKLEIERASKMCVDPEKLRKANNAVNLSEWLLPTNADGNISLSKIKAGKFNRTKFYRLVNDDYNALKDAIKGIRSQSSTLTALDISKNLKIDENGQVWYKDGCNWLPVPAQTEPVEVVMQGNIDNTVMFKGHSIIPVMSAAIEIRNNPNSEFSLECISLHEFINNWKKNTDAVKRYGELKI